MSALLGQSSTGLIFSRVPLLRGWLDTVGGRWEDLGWRAIELTGSEIWRSGGVVRAGSRVAFTYQDRGIKGRLDEADLCLDFDRGARVRTLGEIFVGEGLVEFAAVEPDE